MRIWRLRPVNSVFTRELFEELWQMKCSGKLPPRLCFHLERIAPAWTALRHAASAYYQPKRGLRGPRPEQRALISDHPPLPGRESLSL